MGKWSFVKKYGNQKIVAGIDEAGSGSQIFSIFAAAVIWDPSQPKIRGLNDSKKLSEKEREKVYGLVVNRCKDWAIGTAELEEVVKLGAYRASALARYRAVKNLKIRPDLVVVDGFSMPEITESAGIPSKAVVRGDTLCSEIMMASVIAKVARDREVVKLHEEFPQYNWKSNKGYYCPEHTVAIIKWGVSAYHRTHLPTVQRALKQRQILQQSGLLEDFQKIESYKHAINFLKAHQLIGEKNARLR